MKIATTKTSPPITESSTCCLKEEYISSQECQQLTTSVFTITKKNPIDFVLSKTAPIFLSTQLTMIIKVLIRALAPTLLRLYYAFLQRQKLIFQYLNGPNEFNRKLLLENVMPSSNEEIVTALNPEPCVNCTVLHEPIDNLIIADVIFIHGLHGGIKKTWRQGKWKPKEDTTTNPQIYRNYTKTFYTDCWPQDWLPQDCPGARVIALNYTTDVLWSPIWTKRRFRTNMIQRSKEMIEELRKLGVGNCPIVWVGHSKGGLFIKQILVTVWEQNYTQNLLENTRAIMFYSVPHRGSAFANFALPLFRRSVELIEIKKDSSTILNLHERFLEVCKSSQFQAEIFSFIETSFTFMTFMYFKIVAFESADLEIGKKYGIPLDHREICKPSDRNCSLYRELVKLINKYSE